MFSARLLIFGDAHIGKHFNKLKAKKDFDKRWEIYLLKHITTTIDKLESKTDIVIFLGDIVDRVTKRNVKILLTLLSSFSKQHFFLLLGNHDAKLPLKGWPKNVSIIKNPCCIEDAIFWPYAGRYPENGAWLPYLRKAKLIFSHNNVYHSPTWYDLPMITLDELREYTDAFFINGHIHRFHAEKNYLQIGAINPTTFRESPFGLGTCLFHKGDFEIIPNETVVFVSWNREESLSKLLDFLNAQKEKGSLIALKTSIKPPKEVLEKIDAIMGVNDA